MNGQYLSKRKLPIIINTVKNEIQWHKWREKHPNAQWLAKQIRTILLPPAIYLPTEILIEVTNFCNCHCQMCPQHSRNPNIAINRKKGVMDLKLFKKIIDEVSRYGNTVVSMIGAGEPMLHPDLECMVRYAKEGGNKTHIITNGQLLTPEGSAKLIHAKLDCIGISIDGATKATHEKIREGSKFDKVVNNVEQLLKLKKQLHSPIPLVRIMMVEMEENKNEVEAVINRWLPQVDEVLISTHRIDTGRRFFCRPDSIHRIPCQRLWRMIVIGWMGKVGLCCDDWGGEVVLGDIHESSIHDIWFSKEFQRIRRLHSKGQYQKISICAQCDSWMDAITYEKEEPGWRVKQNPYTRVYSRIDGTLRRKSLDG